MKRFQFSLETVFHYKKQVLDALMGELGEIQAQVLAQEDVLDRVQAYYRRQGDAFRERQREGITIPEALLYENELRVLEAEIQRETCTLAQLRKQEEEKREQMVEAKKETMSLEKLKDKRLSSYDAAVRRGEELLVEEFVSNAMSAVAGE